MYARVTRSKTPLEGIDGAISWFRESALPRAQAMDGFRGTLLLVDRETGEGMSVTLWESKEARDASEQAADALREEGVSSADFELLGVDRYEVAVSSL
jgi:heme-degrading monooxygenase HmoA